MHLYCRQPTWRSFRIMSFHHQRLQSNVWCLWHFQPWPFLSEPLKRSPTVNKKGDAGQNPKSGALSEHTVRHSTAGLFGPGKTLLQLFPWGNLFLCVCVSVYRSVCSVFRQGRCAAAAAVLLFKHKNWWISCKLKRAWRGLRYVNITYTHATVKKKLTFSDLNFCFKYSTKSVSVCYCH